MKNIYVILTKSPTVLSRVIALTESTAYTHSSIAFTPDLETMYSFGRKYPRNPFIGVFKTENVHAGFHKLCKTLPGVVLELPVSDEQYSAASRLVAAFMRGRELYRYNYSGLFLNFLRMGDLISENRRRFFCSEFVYHVLRSSGICDFNQPRWLVKPHDFLKLPAREIFRGDLKSYHHMRSRGFRLANMRSTLIDANCK
jgi:hypothetical protein